MRFWELFRTTTVIVLILGASSSSSEEAPSEFDNMTWDYVALGGSIGTQWFEHYGEMIEADQSVEVAYRNYYVPLQKVSALLKEVTENPDIRTDIADAEIITIGVGFADMRWALTMWGSERMHPDSEGMNEAVDQFCHHYDDMLSEVVSLAAPAAIVQIMDFYFPYVSNHNDRGIYESTKQDWSRFNECIAEAGRNYEVSVAQVYEAFNGPLGDDDPAEKGYLDAGGKHASEMGMQVIAKQFRDLGYERALQ